MFTAFGLAVKESDKQNMYHALCLEKGYVQAYEKGNAWYCLSFGNEPRIERLNIEEQC